MEDHECNQNRQSSPDAGTDVAVQESEDGEGDTARDHAQPRGEDLECEAAARPVVRHLSEIRWGIILLVVSVTVSS